MKRSMVLSGILTLMVLCAAGRSADAQSLSGTDYAEINMLYSRYAYAFDSADGEMFASVFAPDGEFVAGARTTTGRKALAAMASRVPKRERPKIFHVTVNVLITPDAVGARGSAYVMTIDLAKNPAISGGGVYEDVIVKTAEGWKFRKRSYFAEPPPPAAAASQPRGR